MLGSYQDTLECPDVPPDTQFPCDFQLVTGGCENLDGLRDPETGLLQYCLVTCGLCDQVDLSLLPDEIKQRSCLDRIQNGIGLCGTSISTDALAAEVNTTFTQALATLYNPNKPGNVTQEVLVDGAISTSKAVSTAVATAFSEVELQAISTNDRSKGNGTAFSQAKAIANATASAYAIAIAEVVSEEAADDFTELEASTMATDIQTALATAEASISVSGVTEVTVRQESYATAVAESVAVATGRAFARIMGLNVEAIALAVAEAFNSSQIECLSFCNNDPPQGDRTCEDYVEADECALVASGFCECDCGTCQIGSEASINTLVNIITENENEAIVVNAFGDAFASGAKGANAVASAIVGVVAQGNSEAAVSALSEAFGAQETDGAALVSVIAETVNEGGENVTKVFVDALALAEAGGHVAALGEAIATALTSGQEADAAAMTQVLVTAIADGGCEAISESLASATAVAAEQGEEDVLAQAISDSVAVNSCFQSLENSTAIFIEAVDVVQNQVSSPEGQVTSAAAVGSSSASATAGDAVSVSSNSTEPGAQPSVVGSAQAVASSTGTDANAEAASQGSDDSVSASSSSVLSDPFPEPDPAPRNETSATSAVTSSISSAGVVPPAQEETAVGPVQTDTVSTQIVTANSTTIGDGKEPAIAVAEADAVAGGTVALESQEDQTRRTIVSSLATSIAEGDSFVVASVATEAFAAGDAVAVAQGFAEALSTGVACDAISSALASTAAAAETSGEQAAFSEAVSNAAGVTECLAGDIAVCQGVLASECCETFAEECRCRFGTCLAQLNTELSIPGLGLYVYDDLGVRQCKCAM